MIKKLVFAIVAILAIISISSIGRDTRTIFITTSYDPPETIEEPIKGDAERIVNILESQSGIIEIDEIHFGGCWIVVKETDGSSVHYNVFSNKMCKAVLDNKENVIESHWYSFTQEEYDLIQSLICKLPKHRG